MVASVTIRVYTGASAATESASVAGIDLLSNDNATNSAANRISYPVSTCSFSYEKIIRAKIDTAPDNKVENFLLWGEGTVMTACKLWVGISTTASAPVATCSPNASAAWSSYTSGGKLTWHSASMKGSGSMTDYCTFQLRVDSSASPGNMAQRTINWSFDEA